MTGLLSKLDLNKKQNLWKTLAQLVKFSLVGISNTVIGLSIYYIFIFINKDLYIIGNTVGFIVSIFNAYFWNNKYVFLKTEKGNIKPLIKSFVVYGSTYLIGTALLYAFVKLLGISEAVAPLLNLIVTIPINFVLNKYWTFK